MELLLTGDFACKDGAFGPSALSVSKRPAVLTSLLFFCDGFSAVQVDHCLV